MTPSMDHVLVPHFPSDTVVVDETSFAEVMFVVPETRAKIEYRSSSPAARLVVPVMENGSLAFWLLTGFTLIKGEAFVAEGQGVPAGVTEGRARSRISRDTPQSVIIR